MTDELGLEESQSKAMQTLLVLRAIGLARRKGRNGIEAKAG